MLFVKDIEKIILLSVLSQYLNKKRPINIMLVAPSESGGSTMMKQFDSISSVAFVSDITYKGLLDTLKDALDGKCKTLMLSDYVKILGRPFTTRMNYETIINQAIEEGVKEILLPNEMKVSFGKFVTLSLVTKVTTEMYNKNILSWYTTGFIQRFLVIKFEYTDDEVSTIMDFIISGKHFEKISFILPEIKNVTVNCKQEYYEILKEKSEKIAFNYGFRVQQQLQLLLDSHALFRYLDNDKIDKNVENIIIDVNESDIKEILRLSDYFYRPKKENRLKYDVSDDSDLSNFMRYNNE